MMGELKRPYEFVPHQDFTAKVNWSENTYHAGHTYTVRVGGAWDHLHQLVQEEWLPAGLVEIGAKPLPATEDAAE